MPATTKAAKAIVYNRVPSVTADFWLIKLMAVTMGETAADYLNVQMGLGLTATSLIMSAVLVGALIWQFAQKKYVPAAYWLSVVLISIVGTLITDNLVDNFHVPLMDTTIAFSIALVLTFLLWFRAERTLSIHSIFTNRREAFYWLAILFTFALGTAAGDLIAEKCALGYLATGVLFGMIIFSLSIGYFFLGLDPILGFWPGLHSDPASRCLVRRPDVSARAIWRPRPRHNHNKLNLSRRDRGDRDLHERAARRRGVGCHR